MPQQRRSDRLFLQIPIHVSGTDAGGEHFEEDSVTVHVNQHGGCISLIHSLRPGGTIQVRHLLNGRESEFRVVGLVREIFSNRAEWGLESTDPTVEFWGIEFTPPPDSPEPKALIKCQACSQVVLAPLSHSGYEILLHTGMLSRHCDRCGETTRWHPSEVPTGSRVATSPAQPLTHDERRKTRRRRLAMRLQLHRASGQTERVRTLDVSKGGLSFISQQVFRVGEEVGFILPSGGQKESVETQGHIDWVRQTPEEWVYGVSFAAEDEVSARPSDRATARLSYKKAS
jgi:hypothetical protein